MDLRVCGGITAYNEGPRLERAWRSLVDQELPPGYQWGPIWIVVSGSTDGTLAVARRLADQDDRARLISQPHREGKASALLEIFRAAQGDLLVLLNGDASARPGAVAALLRAAERRSGAFAVMGRPFLAPGEGGVLAPGLGLLWEIHHRMHLEILDQGQSNHLSDELWLLPLPVPTPLPPGTVNDGSYVGAYLRANGGSLHYAPGAEVDIRAPSHVSDHVRQRRRIYWGHRQIEEALGERPTTWMNYVREDPPAAFRMLVDVLRRQPQGLRWFLLFSLLEGQARVLAAWDRRVGTVDYVRWRPTREPAPAARGGKGRSSPHLEGDAL